MGWLLDGLSALSGETAAPFLGFCSAASKGTTCCRGGRREHLKSPFRSLQQQYIYVHATMLRLAGRLKLYLLSLNNTAEPNRGGFVEAPSGEQTQSLEVKNVTRTVAPAAIGPHIPHVMRSGMLIRQEIKWAKDPFCEDHKSIRYLRVRFINRVIRLKSAKALVLLGRRNFCDNGGHQALKVQWCNEFAEHKSNLHSCLLRNAEWAQ